MNKLNKLTFLAASIFAFAASPVSAQTNLLTIEFNEDDQDEFDIWPSALTGSESTAEFATDPAVTSGTTTFLITSNTTLNVPANRGSLNGDPVGYTFQGLYEDLLHAGTPTGFLTFDVSGLNPNQAYLFTLYAWDPGATDTSDKEWTVTEGTADPSVISVNFQDALVDNETFALEFEITTTAAGTFQVVNTDGLPQSAVNGFKLDAIGGAGAELQITTINYTPENDTLGLTWTSVEGQTYRVKYSTDLQNWNSTLGDPVEAAAGGETSVVADLSGTDISGAEQVFFRVELSD